jgi:hypothetical protein
MILFAIAGRTISGWLRRAILALAPPTRHASRDVPPEFYKFPLF